MMMTKLFDYSLCDVMKMEMETDGFIEFVYNKQFFLTIDNFCKILFDFFKVFLVGFFLWFST
jgi:hypothetical protein